MGPSATSWRMGALSSNLGRNLATFDLKPTVIPVGFLGPVPDVQHPLDLRYTFHLDLLDMQYCIPTEMQTESAEPQTASAPPKSPKPKTSPYTSPYTRLLTRPSLHQNCRNTKFAATLQVSESLHVSAEIRVGEGAPGCC